MRAQIPIFVEIDPQKPFLASDGTELAERGQNRISAHTTRRPAFYETFILRRVIVLLCFPDRDYPRRKNK